MSYQFKQETYEYLLKEILGYKNLAVLGKGAQSVVWRGTGKDNVEVAIKVAFCDKKLVEAETQLKEYMPEYLKDKKQISKIFDQDSKQLEKGIERYYKYMIVFNSNEENNNDIMERLINYDFIQNGWKLSTEEILKLFTEDKGEYKALDKNVVDLNGVCTFLTGGSAQRKHFVFALRARSNEFGIGASDITSILDFFKEFKKNKFFVLTGSIADKDLAEYIQHHETLSDLKSVLLEVGKLAKHVLKGLSALHNSNIAACDIHPGNVTVTEVATPDGQKKKIKYQLIDFGSSQKLDGEDKEYLIKDDLYRLDYALLIPTFEALNNNQELKQIPSESNYDNINHIKELLQKIDNGSVKDLFSAFINFLEALKDKKYNVDTDALNADFFKKIKSLSE